MRTANGLSPSFRKSKMLDLTLLVPPETCDGGFTGTAVQPWLNP